MDIAAPLCLAATGLLSVVLPMRASSAIRKPADWTPSLRRYVWEGQLLIGAGGLLTVLFPAHPLLGLGLAASACIAGNCRLTQLARSVEPGTALPNF